MKKCSKCKIKKDLNDFYKDRATKSGLTFKCKACISTEAKIKRRNKPLNRFYVYAHMISGTNEIFYIGKGSDKRAYSLKSRNKYWNSIVNKYGYDINILEENLLEKQAFDREIALIKEIRPKANLTEGGEGTDTFKLMSKEDKYKFKENARIRAYLPGSGVQTAAELRRGKTKETCSSLLSMSIKNSIKLSGSNNPMYGKSYWDNKDEEEKEEIKTRISETLKATYANAPRIYKKVTCPHCGKTGGTPGLTRYHFDNCKFKK